MKSLEVIQNKFLRYSSGLPLSTRISDLYDLCGTTSIKHRVHHLSKKWFESASMENPGIKDFQKNNVHIFQGYDTHLTPFHILKKIPL